MTNNKSESSKGFDYLYGRFLKKNGRYIDTTEQGLPQYQADDLKAVLRSERFNQDQCQWATQRLKTDDLRVWSGREVFVPGASRIIDRNGMADINAWVPAVVKPVEGDPGPFLEYLARLVPIEAERDWLLNFLAYRYQHPSEKPRHGVILYGGQGTGKSTLGGIVERVYGNTKRVTSVDGLVGRFSAPNWLSSWVFGEEIKVTAGGGTYNALKDLITGDKKEGERKGQDFATFDIPAALLLCTNYEPSFIEPDDRRFFIAEVTSEDTEDDRARYFNGLYRWLAQEEGYGKIAWLLQHRDTGEYSPAAPPIMTEAKRRLVGLVTTGVQQEVSDWLDDLGRDVLLDGELTEAFERVSSEQMRHLMSGAGWEKHHKRVTLHGAKRRLWHRRGTKIVTASGQKAMFSDLEGNTRPLEGLVEDCNAL